MNAEEIVTELTPSQADGLACVACGADYLRVRVRHVPVSLSVTGPQVFACVGCLSDDQQSEQGGVLR